MASVGGFAGVRSKAAILWLDAHADFHTPETTETGFLDGMALAVMTGRCWSDQTYRVAGFRALPDKELVMAGVRSVDPGEKPALQGVAIVQDETELKAALQKVAREELYVHIDLDALDSSVLTANAYSTVGGLTREMLDACVKAARNKRVVALAFTAYDPSQDIANAGPAIVLDTIQAIAAKV